MVRAVRLGALRRHLPDNHAALQIQDPGIGKDRLLLDPAAAHHIDLDRDVPWQDEAALVEVLMIDLIDRCNQRALAEGRACEHHTGEQNDR